VPDDVPSLTLAVLKEIRDEVRKTNDRLEQTNDRLERLETRQTDMEMRLATELIAVTSAVREVGDLFKDNAAVRGKVDEHETRIAALERKVS
jgi:chromosome segregation ATPase